MSGRAIDGAPPDTPKNAWARPVYDALYGPIFAWTYDGNMRRAEEAGLRTLRRNLLRAAIGRTLEIGAGTGLNLDHYTREVTELSLAEPSLPMLRRLERRVAAAERKATIVQCGGEQLPFATGCFDTVVVTLVLCTARRPLAVAREIGRVLAPSGQLLFLEHVRSKDPGLARWQDRFAGAWRWLADGCVCNRDTRTLLDAAPLTLDGVRDDILPNLGPLVSPLIVGRARRIPQPSLRAGYSP